MWFNLILFILVSLSVTNIVVREYVFEWLRSYIRKWFPNSLLNKMIHCPTCAGFWVGILLSFIFPPLIGGFWLNLLVFGTISSIINMIFDIKMFKF